MNIYIPTENDIIHETSVDFVLRPCAKEIYIVQYDKSLPIIKVELYRNGERYVLPETGVVVNVRLGKLDKTFVYKSILGTNAERNTVYFEIDEQMATIPGHVGPVIEVIEGSKVACSSPIHVVIEKNPIQNGQIESEDYFPIIYELQGTVADHELRIEALEQQVTGEVVTLHTDQDNIDGQKTFKNTLTVDIEDDDDPTKEVLILRNAPGYHGAKLITFGTDDGDADFMTITNDDALSAEYLDLHNVAHIYGLLTPVENDEAVNKEYADRKLELHSFNGFVGGTQVHDQVSNGQIMYCQSGTQSEVDPTQSPIINIELTQEHLTLSKSKAMYLNKITIHYIVDGSEEEMTWSYTITSRLFVHASGGTDVTPKVVTLTDSTTNVSLDWSLIYRPFTGKQYYAAYVSGKGQQFGSSSNPAEYISLYTTSLQNVTVTAVEIEVCGASQTLAKVKLTLVQDQWTVNNVIDPTITTTVDEYDWEHENGTHLGSGGGVIIEYNHVFLKKENNIVTTIDPDSTRLYIEEDVTKPSDTYRLYKYVGTQMQEVSKTRLGSTADTAYRGDWGDENYRNITRILSGNGTEFTGNKVFQNEVEVIGKFNGNNNVVTHRQLNPLLHIIPTDKFASFKDPGSESGVYRNIYWANGAQMTVEDVQSLIEMEEDQGESGNGVNNPLFASNDKDVYLSKSYDAYGYLIARRYLRGDNDDAFDWIVIVIEYGEPNDFRPSQNMFICEGYPTRYIKPTYGENAHAIAIGGYDTLTEQEALAILNGTNS